MKEFLKTQHTKPDLKRAERRARERSERRLEKHREVTGSKFRRWSLLVGVGALAVLLSVIAVVMWKPGLAQTGPGTFFPSQGHCHIGQSCPPPDTQYENFPYNSDPPTSGPHVERFPPAFIQDVPLPKRILVHILEHGNVMILYNEKASPDLVSKLRSYAENYDRPYWFLQTPQVPGADISEQLEAAQAVFVAPYPGMKHTIALAAWTRLDAFDTYDQARIDRFVRAWVGNAKNARQ